MTLLFYINDMCHEYKDMLDFNLFSRRDRVDYVISK